MLMRKRFEYLPFRPDDESGAAPPAPSAPAETVLSGETSVPGDSSSGGEFEGLGDFDEIEIEAPTTPAAGTTSASSQPAVQTPPTASPSGSPSPVSSTPQQPAQAAPTPGGAAPQPTGAPQATPAAASPAPQEQGATPPASLPADVASMLREFEANRDGLIESLAANERFQLSQDEALMLETDPGKAVPRLLARTYYMAVNATLTHINNLVPGMIHRQVEGQRIQKEREDKLYSMFKALDRTKHHGDVLSFAQIFRAQNPALKFEELAPLVGAAVMAKYGLTAPLAAPPGANGALPQSVSQPPFVPAKPGVAMTPTVVEESAYAGLGQEWPD